MDDIQTNPRPWLDHYPEGIPALIAPPPYNLLGQLAVQQAQRLGSKTAYTCVLPNGMAGSLSYAEIDRLSDAFAAWLREDLGLKPGDRVALQIPNGLAYPVIAFGVFKASCILVNVNPLYTADEMGKMFADAQPSVAVVIDVFADKLAQALKAHPVRHVVLSSAAEFFATFHRTLIGIVQKYVRKEVPNPAFSHLRLAEAVRRGQVRLQKGADVKAYTAKATPNDIACLQYTGGTTGISKAAMLTHSNLLFNTVQFLSFANGVLTEKTVILTALPLYHIFAFTVNFLGIHFVGGCNVLIPNPRPLTNLKPAFEKFDITFLSGVNTLFNGLMNEQWFRDAPPKHLDCSVAGGMALQQAVAERWSKVTSTSIYEGYGLTEASPVLSFNPFGSGEAGSIGVPLPSTDLKCVDANFNTVPLGEPGELAARGPQVMLGYWNRPDETAKVLRDGWLLTGDIATMNANGYFRIVDRSKDMILVSGFNVYPNEIEEALAHLPGVKECAVVGVPDENSGEAPKAFIVKSDPNLTAEMVRAYCKQHLTGYKVPKYVEFRDDLPKSNVGKILRKDLRAAAK